MGRAAQICPTPGCPNITPKGRCDDCQAKARAQRPSPTAKGYDARWQRTRRAYLRAHPYCECDDHAQQPTLLRPVATEVNHIDGLGPLGPHGHDWHNLQAMTKACHSKHTAREQPGGWNNREQ